jgi:TRAP-type mannitol/chloroaromatic compound transport system substrate-binding protein
VPLPKSILDAAWKATQDLYAELAAKNPQWRKIHGSYAHFLQEKVWGWGHAEMGFDRYMNEQLSKAAAARPRKKSAPARRQ